MKIDFYYDIVCPYAYLGSTQIDAIAKRHGATVEYKPFLLGGALRSHGVDADPNAAMPPAKARLNALDMMRWADHFGVPLELPSQHPRRTVLALRAILAAGEPDQDQVTAMRALFRAYWVDGLDVAAPGVVVSTLDRAGLDGAALVERATTDAIKKELRRRTDEAVARGVFGAPSVFVGDEMFWGQDRLDFVDRALAAVV